MKKSFLHLMAVAVIATMFTLSCTKDEIQQEVQQEYPSELTLENFEEFLTAPKEVWTAVSAKYRAEHPTSKKPIAQYPQDQKAPCFGSNRCGSVAAWNGSFWQGIQGVDIVETQTGRTASTNGIGTFIIQGSGITQWCMSYQTPQLNGVDMDDIMAIMDHILQVDVFDDELPESNAVRMYMAADANLDGSIDVGDMVTIRRAMLFGDPLGKNVTIVANPQMELFTATDPFGLTLLQIDCYSSALDQRRVVKIGDVTGDFSF